MLKFSLNFFSSPAIVPDNLIKKEHVFGFLKIQEPMDMASRDFHGIFEGS
ncbi:MAG: hypothetical protein ACTSYS_16955 [Promethearchaeota archaeon]